MNLEDMHFILLLSNAASVFVGMYQKKFIYFETRGYHESNYSLCIGFYVICFYLISYSLL